MYLLETQQFALRDTRDPHADDSAKFEGSICVEWSENKGCPMSAPFPYLGSASRDSAIIDAMAFIVANRNCLGWG